MNLPQEDFSEPIKPPSQREIILTQKRAEVVAMLNKLGIEPFSENNPYAEDIERLFFSENLKEIKEIEKKFKKILAQKEFTDN